MEYITKFLVKDGFIVALFVSGVILFLSSWMSVALTRKKIPGAAIAIFSGLLLAYIGGVITDGKNGISDISIFSGFAFMGGSVLRDFTIVATAMGARFSEIRKAGLAGTVSLFVGVVFSFIIGAVIAWLMGYDDAKSITTIGAGACTFIVGPVTGSAVGASSEVIALSIAAGVVKSIFITICTPMVAKSIQLNSPSVAMIYGGLIGTTSGVAAGLAATDPKLVPYGAITATFYTGLGCLLCPSILYLMIQWIF
jgi:malonate transporter MadM subunit